MKLFYHFFCSILFFLVSTASFGQVVDTTFSATMDSYVISNEINTNKGSINPLNVGRYANRAMLGQPTTYNTRRTVIEFDFSTIPSNAVIVLAKLKLNQTASSGSPVIHAGRLKTSWHEDTITWTNQPSYETYDLISSSSLVSGWLTIDVKNHVQNMVAGVYANHGWLLLNNSEVVNASVYRNLRSREDGNSSLRPELEIEYYIPIEVSSALIEHESSDGEEDGSVYPTLNNGPGGLSYKWYNSEDSVISTSLNLEDVPYGWYGLEVASSNVSDTFYYAFIVGLHCAEVEIPFNPGPNYVDDAMIFDKPPITSLQSESNYGTNPYVEASGAGVGPSQRRSLLKFRVWVDSALIVNQATLNLTGHSNSGHSTYFKNVTSNWYENTVTHSSIPSLGTTTALLSGFMSIDATADIVANVEEWQLDNNSNYGWLLELQTYTGLAGVYVRFHSSDNGTPTNRPNIDFTLDLRRPPVVMEWDTVVQAGDVFIDLNNVCGKTAPYKYIIAQDSIPDLSDLYAFINDSIFSGELDSTSFFSGTTDLTKLYDSLSSGKYYIAVFDSTWNRIVDEEIHVQKEFSFSSQTGLIANKDTITATQNDAIGSLEMYVHEGLTAHLNSQFLGLSGSQYVGFSEIDSTVNSYEDLMYGFYIEEDTVYTVQAGIPSMSYTLINSTALLTMHIADTVLYLSIDGDTVFTKVLASGFAYKTDVGLQNGKSLFLGPYMLPYKLPIARFKGRVVQHLTCSGDPGSIEFRVGIFTYLGGPFPVVYNVEDEDGNPVVTGGTTTTGLYQPVTEYEGSLDPLLPGRYKISGIVNSSHTFVGYVTLGYEADWNQVLDYDHIPNPYSLMRTLPTTTNIQQSSFARTTNFLDAGNEGWVEYKPVIGSSELGYSLMRLSAQNLNSMTFGPTEDFLLFFRFFGSQWMFGQIDNVNYPLTPLTLNSQVKVEFLASAANIWVNNSFWSTPTVTPSTRLIRCQTPFQDFGFESIITTFDCPPSPSLNFMSYTRLKRKMDAGYSFAVDGKIKFSFIEEYDMGTGKFIPLRIYDKNGGVLEEVFLDGSTLNAYVTPASYVFADNNILFDLTGVAGMINGELYVLEVTTYNGEKKYMRFIYNN